MKNSRVGKIENASEIQSDPRGKNVVSTPPLPHIVFTHISLYLPCPDWECAASSAAVLPRAVALLAPSSVCLPRAKSCPGAALACCLLVNWTVVFLCVLTAQRGEEKRRVVGGVRDRRGSLGVELTVARQTISRSCIQFQVLCIQLLSSSAELEEISEGTTTNNNNNCQLATTTNN